MNQGSLLFRLRRTLPLCTSGTSSGVWNMSAPTEGTSSNPRLHEPMGNPAGMSQAGISSPQNTGSATSTDRLPCDLRKGSALGDNLDLALGKGVAKH